MEPVNIINTKQWNSIDIFLFSNGQQYSPPRKYHLRSEELQWWETTISYLGQTHYGSGHSSIELYTIDGRKVDGPLELINGSAYVAVEPPDSFVNTGYEEYLLRATRSREKREAQKIHNNEVVNHSDLRCEKDLTGRKTADDINASHTAEKSPDSASFREMKNTTTLPVKPRLNKPQQRLQRKSIMSPKQIQKKKSFDTNSAALKRICADPNKVISCPKRTIQKKKDCIVKQSTPTRQINENQEQLRCYKTRNTMRLECNEGHKNSIQSDKTYQLFPINNDSDLNINIEKEQPIIDLYNNKKSELTSLNNNPELYSKNINIEQKEAGHTFDNVPTQDNHVNVNDSNYNETSKNINLNILTNKLNPPNEPYQGNDLLNTDILNNGVERVSLHNISKDINGDAEKSHINDVDLNQEPVFEKEVSDEYVAHMNKGDILRLKLKIKLKDCKTIFYRNKSKNCTSPKSLSGLPKNEKTSQVDININFSGELLKTTDEDTNEYATQYKSLQSLLNKLCTEATDEMKCKNSKIIILQCACSNQTDKIKSPNRENSFGECEVEETQYRSTFNNRKSNEMFTSCMCQNDSLRASKDVNFNENFITRPLGKDAYNKRLSISKGNGWRVKYLAQKFEDVEATQNGKNKNGNKDIPWHGTDGLPAEVTKLTSISTLEDRAKYDIEDTNTNTGGTRDESTQTDWCNILLEARRHEDNNYSFHLPSLYILKQCY